MRTERHTLGFGYRGGGLGGGVVGLLGRMEAGG